MPTLSDAHRHQLEAGSTISPAIIDQRGYSTARFNKDCRSIGFFGAQARTPALVIPLHGVDGTQDRYQLRPDIPRMTKAGRETKYEHQAGQRMMLDCHPAFHAALAQPDVPLWITEGVKKADALASRGIACIALMGVWNWRGRNSYDGLTVLPDWEHVALNGRDVFLVFDNDSHHKIEVLTALRRLHRWLEYRKSHVRIINLPDRPDKLGVDDALAEGLTVEDLVGMAVTGCPDLPKQAQADILSGYFDAVNLVLDEAQDVWAVVPAEGHTKTYSVPDRAEKGNLLRAWVMHKFHAEHNMIVSPSELAKAMDQLWSTGQNDPDVPRQAVFFRIGHRNKTAIYIDLGTPDWSCIEIDAEGWRIRQDAPVLFRRHTGMLPLPLPESGGSMALLRDVLPFEADSTGEVLIWSWLLGVLLPDGPYPHLCLHGEQGSAKSFTTGILRSLLDPCRSPLDGLPKDEESLALIGKDSAIVTAENVSQITLEQSDWFCRLATGLGFKARKLYSNDMLRIIYVKRPAILNGINEVVTQGDLRDRALVVTMARLATWSSESALQAIFDITHGKILGALCDATVVALHRQHEVSELGSVRMADFARWVIAASPAFGWDEQTFLGIYGTMQGEAIHTEVEADIIGVTLLELLEDTAGDDPDNAGLGLRNDLTMGGLHTILTNRVTRQEGVNQEGNLVYIEGAKPVPKSWPSDATRLSKRLRRLMPALRQLGWEIVFDRVNHNGRKQRVVRVRYNDPSVPASVPPSVPSVPPSVPRGTLGERWNASDPEGNASELSQRSQPNPLENQDLPTSNTTRNARNANLHTYREEEAQKGENAIEGLHNIKSRENSVPSVLAFPCTDEQYPDEQASREVRTRCPRCRHNGLMGHGTAAVFCPQCNWREED